MSNGSDCVQTISGHLPLASIIMYLYFPSGSFFFVYVIFVTFKGLEEFMGRHSFSTRPTKMVLVHITG